MKVRYNMKKKLYEIPRTQHVEVELENCLCAASKENVVINDDNTTTTIEQQQNGGSFEIDTWN